MKLNNSVQTKYFLGHLGDGNIHINIVSESNKDKLIDEVYVF